MVAKPHFPWRGDGRFWECHLTVPGELDVYGVSLIGTPLVQMGFNRHVAWTSSAPGIDSASFRSTQGQVQSSYRFGNPRNDLTGPSHFGPRQW